MSEHGDSQKSAHPTDAELEMLLAVASQRSHGMALTTNRQYRRSVALRCVAKGWLREVQCVRCDGDGFSLEPERWSPGFELTPTGDLALRRPEDVSNAV